MRSRYLVLGLVLVAVFAITAGCTQSTPTPPPATTPATAATTPPPTTTAAATTAPATTATVAAPLTPGPVETIPALYTVEVQVTRNTVSISPDIVTTFRGGRGMNFVQSVDVKVTRSDGEVKTGTLVKPRVDDAVTIEGTRADDRVEVTVNLVDGKNYKIYDEVLPFRAYH